MAFGWWLYNADSTLTCINVIDWYGFYNNREEDSYTTMHNDRLQLIQWSNITTSCISIDSIAKLSPIIQCISVIVPFGFYRIGCLILSIDWILSINHSFDYLSLMIGKYLKKTNQSNGWIIIINLILIDRSYPTILFMINNIKEINGIQYDYKTNE